MKSKILITAAFEPELKPLKIALKKQKNIVFSTTGIGFTQAAAKTTEALLKIKPKQVIFVGSSGAYSKKIPLLTIVCALESKIADYVFASKKSYNPKNYLHSFKADNKLIKQLKSTKDNQIFFSAIYSSISITKDQSIAQRFLEKDHYFENLELYGVAQACSNLEIPWNAISVVTNYIGKNAHLEWLKNYQAAAAVLNRLSSFLSTH